MRLRFAMLRTLTKFHYIILYYTIQDDGRKKGCVSLLFLVRYNKQKFVSLTFCTEHLSIFHRGLKFDLGSLILHTTIHSLEHHLHKNAHLIAYLLLCALQLCFVFSFFLADCVCQKYIKIYNRIQIDTEGVRVYSFLFLCSFESPGFYITIFCLFRSLFFLPSF